MSQQDAHILRALISIQGSVPPDDGNLRRALSELLTQAAPAEEMPQGTSVTSPIALNDIVTVRAADDAEPEESTFQVVLPPFSNAAEGKISVFAPMSVGVLGRRCGEHVTFSTPGGRRSVEIVHVQKG